MLITVKKQLLNNERGITMSRNDKEIIIQKIRTQYTEKQHSALDELKELDAKVKRPVKVFAYVFGIIGAIIMGSGMSLVMTDIGSVIGISSSMMPGIIIGIAGMLIALINYPIYSGILGARRKKYAQQIMELSAKVIDDK